MSGSTPLGMPGGQDAARSEEAAANWVRGMFGRVAHRYDLANHLLSFNIDRYRSEERRVGKECRSRWSPYH